jgi:hypothetical protein
MPAPVSVSGICTGIRGDPAPHRTVHSRLASVLWRPAVKPAHSVHRYRDIGGSAHRHRHLPGVLQSACIGIGNRHQHRCPRLVS